MWKYFLFGDIKYQMYFSSKSFLPDLSGKKEWKLERAKKKIKINKKNLLLVSFVFLRDHQMKLQKNLAT